jgi:hypothetical protein
MRTLTELLTTPEGVDFLAARGAYTTPERFQAQLRPPAAGALRTALGVDAPLLVCTFQQIYLDYHWSVLHKILALRALAGEPTPAPALHSFFLWMDTDRTGSDRLHTSPAWPPSIARIAPRKASEDRELRYVPLERAQVERMLEQLVTQLAHAPDRRRTGPRYRALREACLQVDRPTLAEFNYHLTEFLLHNTLGYVPPSRRLADLLAQGLLIEQIDHFLNRLPQIVAVFNAAIKALIAQDIDPQVVPIGDDYLPLNYSCPVDNRRLRLRHEIENGDHFAVARCHCGADYRFYLGRRTLALADLAQTGRWSPTVCLPMFLTPLVSGLVVGRSSALYGLVFNEVLRRALDWTPLPMYVPAGLGGPAGAATPDSLLYHYFYGMEA